MLGIGPITKSVQDAKLIYNIIAKKQAVEQSLNKFSIDILSATDYPLMSGNGNEEALFQFGLEIEKECAMYKRVI